MRLQKDKIGYMINYGLAPYFLREFQENCKKYDFLVLGFDESLNKIVQKGQMDVFIRFFDPETNQVCTRYYNSSFLGHSTADDFMNSFKNASEGLDYEEMLQISMDGPNVNKKFLNDTT